MKTAGASAIGKPNCSLRFNCSPLLRETKSDPLSDQPGNEFLAIFLFSDIGNLVESRVDELGPRSSLNHELVAALFAQRLHELGNLTFHDIRVKPFAVEHFGTMMGLIPRKYDEQWCVELHPGSFTAFNEPWDSGIYDT